MRRIAPIWCRLLAPALARRWHRWCHQLGYRFVEFLFRGPLADRFAYHLGGKFVWVKPVLLASAASQSIDVAMHHFILEKRGSVSTRRQAIPGTKKGGMRRHGGRPCTVVLLTLVFAAGFLLVGSVMAPAARADIFDNVFAPHVYSTYPSEGADGCALDEGPSVVFDTDMAASTINEDSFYMDHVVGREWVGGVLVPIFARVEAWVGSWGDNRSFYLVLEEDLEPGTAYLVHLTGRILGRHKVTRTWTQLADTPYIWSFTTATYPKIVSRTPAPGATEVPLDQEVSIEFDLAVSGVDADSVYLQRAVRSSGASAMSPVSRSRTPAAPSTKTTKDPVLTLPATSLALTQTVVGNHALEVHASGHGQKLRPVLDVAFLHDLRHMVLHGARGKRHPGADFFVGEPLDNQRQDFGLALGQALQRSSRSRLVHRLMRAHFWGFRHPGELGKVRWPGFVGQPRRVLR